MNGAQAEEQAPAPVAPQLSARAHLALADNALGEGENLAPQLQQFSRQVASLPVELGADQANDIMHHQTTLVNTAKFNMRNHIEAASGVAPEFSPTPQAPFLTSNPTSSMHIPPGRMRSIHANAAIKNQLSSHASVLAAHMTVMNDVARHAINVARANLPPPQRMYGAN